ncbi:hypothetical protein [Arthrobacter sp. ISL-30]|uniref:hypothetical protein n=1 Tax=Arthrobacter sp. ISL-30 TaxID=2819109 RepID=UPI001BEC46CE|nr:hypothetical protein [Arthrobacter sp. ISL-30]MBT2511970.1 hypothetical protein [Arthrobacter sp. ISL-30]
MSRFLVASFLLAATGLGSACEPEGYACPAIAMAPVVSLTIPASYAPSVKAVHLKACQEETCKEGNLELMPGTVSVDQGCEPGPDGSCSATASPDGTLRGMLMMDALTESPINATASATASDGNPLPVHSLTFTPKAEYPFGAHCGKFLTAGLILDEAGLRQE